MLRSKVTFILLTIAALFTVGLFMFSSGETAVSAQTDSVQASWRIQ
jgi:hypothetical protein